MPKGTFDKIAPEKKERLLREASRLFAERGFSQTDIAELAARAKVAKGSVYNYFESKDELYLHVCRSALEQSRTAVWGDVDPAWSIYEVIEHLFREGLAFATENPHYVTLYLNVSSPGMERFAQDLTSEVERHTARKLTGLIERGVTEGIVNEHVDIRWAAFFINSIYITLLASLVSPHYKIRLREYLELEHEPDRESIEGHLEQIISLVSCPLKMGALSSASTTAS